MAIVVVVVVVEVEVVEVAEVAVEVEAQVHVVGDFVHLGELRYRLGIAKASLLYR